MNGRDEELARLMNTSIRDLSEEDLWELTRLTAAAEMAYRELGRRSKEGERQPMTEGLDEVPEVRLPTTLYDAKFPCPHGPNWQAMGDSCGGGCNWCGGTGEVSISYLVRQLEEAWAENERLDESLYASEYHSGVES